MQTKQEEIQIREEANLRKNKIQNNAKNSGLISRSESLVVNETKLKEMGKTFQRNIA